MFVFDKEKNFATDSRRTRTCEAGCKQGRCHDTRHSCSDKNKIAE